jgi:tRNA 2-selenouridine synthase
MPDKTAVTASAALFERKQTLLDVRSPIEFNRGAFPNALNLPLLTDGEREAVGIRYKQSGQEAAIRLGEELVSGELKKQRMDQWRQCIKNHPNAVLYCFRGGLRSSTVQSWLAEEGLKVTIVNGGYKSLRKYCLNTIEEAASLKKFLVIGGKTGCAKTHLLEKLIHSIDLEGAANHRGSAFGRRVNDQPSQIDFENQLAISLMEINFTAANKIFLEDESKAIGSLSVPIPLIQEMRISPLALIEETLESRVATILDDYIISNHQEYEAIARESYSELFAEFLLSSLIRIRRRLGEENYSEIKSLMDQALITNNHEEAREIHRAWIEKLLTNYYDPMYDYQLEKKAQRLVFRGCKDEFTNWASNIDKVL